MEIIELLSRGVIARLLKYCSLAAVFWHVSVIVANPVRSSDHSYLITKNYWVSGTCLLYGIMNRARMRNELFLGLVEMVGEAILLSSPLRKGNLSHWMMERIQKPNNHNCNMLLWRPLVLTFDLFMVSLSLLMWTLSL